MNTQQVNPYTIDHIVLNVDKNYQEEQSFIAEVNEKKLPYAPHKGKGNQGFKATNLWLGEQYLEMIQIKTPQGGGWIEEWVKRYHLGQRGLIGVFLKTADITLTSEQLLDVGCTPPERIRFAFFFELIKLSAKWRNAYLPFFSGLPCQLGFQQVDSPKIEEGMQRRMVPNSQANGITGIKAVIFHGPLTESDIYRLKQAFYCLESNVGLVLPLEKGQALYFQQSATVETEIILDTKELVIAPIQIENCTLKSGEYLKERLA